MVVLLVVIKCYLVNGYCVYFMLFLYVWFLIILFVVNIYRKMRFFYINLYFIMIVFFLYIYCIIIIVIWFELFDVVGLFVIKNYVGGFGDYEILI